ncbi:MAG: hypothetical protein IJD97_03635 [Clostridia bacterium]|nr:hypothetical protein [Clostridia bacterium]
MKKDYKRERVISFATVSLIINMAYAIGNFLLGLFQKSYWFMTSGTYYMVLGVMRFAAVLFYKRRKESYRDELFVQRFSGIMLVFLSVVLSCSVYLSIRLDMAREIHEIAMITIALYAFTKMTLAVIKTVKVKKTESPLITSLRCISLSDAAVSIFSLQRSMLVSFEGMTAKEITLMNSLTGAGVCLVVLVLGIILIKRKGEQK